MPVSYPSLENAFHAVKDNHGCAGVDGITIENFEQELDANLFALENELVHKNYHPLPLMKILVAKKNGEPRGLCIPTVRDRIVQKAVLEQIEPILEKEFEECSFAYRKGRSVKQAVFKIKEYYDLGYRWVVEADIDAFFDTVNHALLMEKFKRYVHDSDIRKLIKLWLAAEIWDGSSLTLLEKGIPQGSPISPILANLFLDQFDEEMLRKGYKYVRYADDFVILCKKSEEAEQALSLSKKVLEKLLLTVDDEDVVSFDEGFKYLGVIFMKSMIMQPFDKPKKPHKVLFYPQTFDIEDYLQRRAINRPARS